MLVQFYQPRNFQPEQLDSFLRKGWFRNGALLNKSDVICLDEQLFSVLNIRLALSDFQFSKSQRKRMRRINRQFRIEEGPIDITPEKEILYQKHKTRFKGFLYDDLNQVFNPYGFEPEFNTREICIYHGNVLIACSFFDRGKHAIASLLALFDERYSKYSLGYCTMLAEVKYALANGFEYYYPGYVMDKPSEFDYKLRIGSYQYRGLDEVWKHRKSLALEDFPARVIEKKLYLAEDLHLQNTSFESIYNPYYTLSYVDYFRNRFVQSAKLLIHKVESNSNIIALEYIYEIELYRLSELARDHDFDYAIDMEASADLKNNAVYLDGLYKYQLIYGEYSTLDLLQQELNCLFNAE